MLKNLSIVGHKMNRLTGVREIMKDIARTLKADPKQQYINLSPGNPLILPELLNLWRELGQKIIASEQYGSIIGRYGMTQGYEPFIQAIITEYNQLYNWGIKTENVLITAGSQSLYFMIANTFAGKTADGKQKKILLPLSPEYTGYDGVVLNAEDLIAIKPEIEKNADRRFKYKIDFSNLKIGEGIGAILCSRPCNPTGNVIADHEMQKLISIAEQNDIPLIIDAAYAAPFPNLVYCPMHLYYSKNIIHCVSLSKAGLPGERVGYAIADARYIEVLEPFQSNIAIHSSRFGQAIAADAILSGALRKVAETVIKPFYLSKQQLFSAEIDRHMPSSLDWYLHQAEGSLFAWIWIDHPKFNDWQFYQELKKVQVLIVPGCSFFPGLNEVWSHKSQCFRVSLTASDQELKEAAIKIAEVAARLCS